MGDVEVQWDVEERWGLAGLLAVSAFVEFMGCFIAAEEDEASVLSQQARA